MRKYISISLILLLSIVFASCSANSTGNDAYAPAHTTTVAYSEESGSGGSKNPENSERKIIRNASLSLEADDVAASYNQLLTYAEERGGYETARNQQQSSGYLSIEARIKINPEYLDEFIAYAEEITKIIQTRITTEDITEGYFDAQTRLQTMEKSLERYYEYLDQARNIEESLSVQTQIDQMTVEIESLKGKLKLWDSMLAESEIEIRMRQTDDPVKLKKEIDWTALSLDDMTYLMQAGLKSVLNVIVGFAQWAVIVIVAAAPLWITALIIIIILRRKAKKRHRNINPQNQPGPDNE